MTWHRWLEDSSECQTNQDSDRTGSETERSGGYWVEKTNEKPALTCSDSTGITFITLNGQIPSTVTWLKYTGNRTASRQNPSLCSAMDPSPFVYLSTLMPHTCGRGLLKRSLSGDYLLTASAVTYNPPIEDRLSCSTTIICLNGPGLVPS